MRIYKGKEYYSITEVSEIIRENTGAIYYHLKNNKEFPEPTIINDIMHYCEEDIEKIREILNKPTKRGRKKQRTYIPKQNNSYARLRVEYAELLKENERLREKLRKLGGDA
ncbi:hypothetical protein [Tepidimicrobium xylanilyticum]